MPPGAKRFSVGGSGISFIAAAKSNTPSAQYRSSSARIKAGLFDPLFSLDLRLVRRNDFPGTNPICEDLLFWCY